jgi:hypothetical protein
MRTSSEVLPTIMKTGSRRVKGVSCVRIIYAKHVILEAQMDFHHTHYLRFVLLGTWYDSH